eukprot:5322779-Amphidinium_carterae.1
MGDNQAFVDMNIYYSRWPRVLTLHVIQHDRSREGSSSSLARRQQPSMGRVRCARILACDIYKKHISADPVACRLPYAVVTRKIELTGWKRYEMNDVFEFTGAHMDITLYRAAQCHALQARRQRGNLRQHLSANPGHSAESEVCVQGGRTGNSSGS